MLFFHRFLSSKISTIVLCVILLFVGYQTALLVYKGYTTESDVRELQSRVTDLTTKRERLIALQGMLQSDFFAEREARLKLGLQKQGERVVVLPPAKSDDSSTHTDSGTGSSNQDVIRGEIKNATLWWNYFFAKR